MFEKGLLNSKSELKFLTEGKAKRIYELKGEKNLILLEFKDDLTAFNSKKKGQFFNKGKVNRNIASVVFRYLKKEGINNHWVSDVGENKMLCEKVLIVPLEVVVRNRWAGSAARKFGIPEGSSLAQPLFEIYYKNDDLEDPFLSEDQALSLKIVEQKEDLEALKRQALLINEKLQSFFRKIRIELVDFKIEFGKILKNSQDLFDEKKGKNFLLSDEISPDTCRLWDLDSGRKMDKDRYRYDMGQVKESYEEVEQRIQNLKTDLLL